MSFSSSLISKLLVSKVPISRSSSVDSLASDYSNSSSVSAASSVEPQGAVAVQEVVEGVDRIFPGAYDVQEPLRLDALGLERWRSFFIYYYRLVLLCRIVREIALERTYAVGVVLPDSDHLATVCIVSIFGAVFFMQYPPPPPAPCVEFAHKLDWLNAYMVEEQEVVEDDAVSVQPGSAGCPEPVFEPPAPFFDISLNDTRAESILTTSRLYPGRPPITSRVTFPPDVRSSKKSERALRRSPRSRILSKIDLTDDETVPGPGWKRFDDSGRKYTFEHLANWVPPRDTTQVKFSWYANISEASRSNLDMEQEYSVQTAERHAREEASKARLLRRYAPAPNTFFRRNNPSSADLLVPTGYPLKIPMPPRVPFEMRTASLAVIIESEEIEEVEDAPIRSSWRAALKTRMAKRCRVRSDGMYSPTR